MNDLAKAVNKRFSPLKIYVDFFRITPTIFVCLRDNQGEAWAEKYTQDFDPVNVDKEQMKRAVDKVLQAYLDEDDSYVDSVMRDFYQIGN